MFLWWSSAFLHMQVPGIPLNAVIASALTGLALGLVFDAVFLRRWIRRVYVAKMWLVITLYLGLSFVAVALFMGLPVGTLAIGAIAGAYMGRRANQVHGDRDVAVLSLRKTALVTASVTGAAALPIGILALGEQDILGLLESLSGMGQASLQGVPGITLIAILCGLLFLMQYWLSRKAGMLAFNIGR